MALFTYITKIHKVSRDMELDILNLIT